MHHAAGRRSASPVMPPSPPSPASSRSPSPPIISSARRRRLWSPPMRSRSTATSGSRSSASSMAPRPVRPPSRPSPDAADRLDFRPPSRSRRLGHRSHHDSRPPSTPPRRSDAEGGQGRPRRQSPSPTPSPSPSSAHSPSPPSTPPAARRLQSVLQRPPRTQHGNRGSTSVASSLLSSARKRAQARPPTPTDILRIDRKLRALAL